MKKMVRSPRRSAPRDDTQPRIVVVGSSNTDMIVRAANIPRPGETVIGGEFRMAGGGKGANQAVAALSVTKWGAQPSAPERKAIERFMTK